MTVFCFVSTLFWAVGTAHNWSMKSKLAAGLSEDGAGLEFNEWLVNLLIMVVLTVVSALATVFFARRAWHRRYSPPGACGSLGDGGDNS